MKFGILYADPPWDYKGRRQNNRTGPTTGSIDYYPSMTMEQLKAFDVQDFCATDCLLFMWTTSPMLDKAVELMASWRFKYKTVAFVWDKQRVVAGNYTMSQCEMCLVGKKGKIPQPRGARNIKQFLSERRTEHSAKPDTIRDRIAEMFPGQLKLELFARKRYPDWYSYGNEV